MLWALIVFGGFALLTASRLGWEIATKGTPPVTTSTDEADLLYCIR